MARALQPLGDGWYAWSPAVRVRLGVGDDGRWHVNALHVDGRVSAGLLRSIPIGRIEAAANAELHSSAPKSAREREARIPDRLRSNAVRGYPDAFYAAVASVYRRLAVTSPRPVGDLAEANDVPMTTAQRWVKEARRRQLLAPGHPGKAG